MFFYGGGEQHFKTLRRTLNTHFTRHLICRLKHSLAALFPATLSKTGQDQVRVSEAPSTPPPHQPRGNSCTRSETAGRTAPRALICVHVCGFVNGLRASLALSSINVTRGRLTCGPQAQSFFFYTTLENFHPEECRDCRVYIIFGLERQLSHFEK